METCSGMYNNKINTLILVFYLIIDCCVDAHLSALNDTQQNTSNKNIYFKEYQFLKEK
jgi:hypothetical protein